MTQRTFLENIIAGTIGEAEVEFAKAAIAKMDAKNAKKKTSLSKTQKENLEVKEHIMEVMATITEPVTAKNVADMAGISTQKASALLKQLAEEGKIVRNEKAGAKPFTFQNV